MSDEKPIEIDGIKMPQLPRCKVCNSEDRYLIQKALDNGELPANISDEFNIPKKSIVTHINDCHREKLISFGAVDYTIRKTAVDTAQILLKMIDKWAKSLEVRNDFKDSDVLKAIELYNKMSGNIVDKHEIKITKTVDEAIKEYLTEE